MHWLVKGSKSELGVKLDVGYFLVGVIWCGALSFFLLYFSYQFRSFLCRPATRVLKKKKLKINVHRPLGTRVVFDDEGNTLPPLARIADAQSGKETLLLDPGMCN